MINEGTVVEFQTALQEEYGKPVRLEEAAEILRDLVTYFDLLAKVTHRMTTDS